MNKKLLGSQREFGPFMTNFLLGRNFDQFILMVGIFIFK